MTVFQKLDISGKSAVDTQEFLDGLLRLKQKVQGIDVAANKSWLRRLVEESNTLAHSAAMMQMNMISIVEQLRGIQVTEPEGEEDRTSAQLQTAQVVDAQRVVSQSNDRLRRKLETLRAANERRRSALERLQTERQFLMNP